MAEEPENHTLSLLREIRSKQDEQSAVMAGHSAQLVEIARDLRLLKQASRLAIGSASVAEQDSLHAVRTAEEAKQMIEELLARPDA